MGLTPGALSYVIKRQARRLVSPSGSTYSEDRLLVSLAIAAHRSFDAIEKDEHTLFHPTESMPDGPAGPDIF